MTLTKSICRAAAVLAISAFWFVSLADGHEPSWGLVASESKVAFGSIKVDAVGESHRFTQLSGKVTNAGRAIIEIALESVDTGIEIRDTRIKRHLFEGMMPGALLIANIDPGLFSSMAPAETTITQVSGMLSLGNRDIDISTRMFVARLSEDRVLVTTDEMILIGTETLGVNDGVDMLMQLARLPSIGRVVPVTLRFVFEKM